MYLSLCILPAEQCCLYAFFHCFLFFNSSNAAREPVPIDGSLVGKCCCPYDLVLVVAMVSMFGTDDDLSSLAGVHTFNSSDRYFGYAVVNAVWHRESIL